MGRIVEPQDETQLNGSPHEAEKPRRPQREAPRMRPSQSSGDATFWTDAAPRRLRDGGYAAATAWDLWWSKRREPSSMARLVHAVGTPLAWGVDLATLSEESRTLVDIADELARGSDVDRYAKGKRQERLREAVRLWLDAARDGNTDVSFALGCLAAAHVIDRLGMQLGAEEGWPLIDFLYATAKDAAGWEARPATTAEAALAQQLAAVELPTTLAYMFPQIKPFSKLAGASAARLAEGLAALLGDKGLPRAAHLTALPGLVACWTRCRAMASQIPKGAWNAPEAEQFQAAFRQCLRWSDSSGMPLLPAPGARPWTADFLAAAYRLTRRKRDAAAAHALLGSAGLAKELPVVDAKPPRPSTLSESARLALLRAAWTPDAATIALDYSGHGMRLEASISGKSLFHGVWTSTSRRDGELLKPTSAWEVVCWFTDKDVDYLEFRMELEGGARLERQALLARRDEFLLLADHLQSQAPAVLEHAWQIPLAHNLAWNPADETREGVIAADGLSARVLPLALPEWRVDPRMGELACGDGALRLAQQATTRALACPVFIDLKPGRSAKPCTWRQLTVAEALQIQPPDVAVGYRVQCGRKQWLFYRSQAERGNRTVMGQNTAAEFLAARFLAPAGEVEELILVEA